MNSELKAVKQSVLEGDMEATKENVDTALSAGNDAGTILQMGLIPAMDQVGKLFEEG